MSNSEAGAKPRRKTSTKSTRNKPSKTNSTTSKTRTEWTDGRKRSFITSALRGAFRRYPTKFEALAMAGVGSKPNKRTNRWAKHYKCRSCGGEFVGSDVNVDHVVPVVDTTEGFVSWDVFIERLFCDVDNLQVLCEECHAIKSKAERSERCSQKKNPIKTKPTTKRSRSLKK